MNNMKKQTLKYLFLFHFGGGTYTTIELLFRNRTYIQMYILGGILFLICGLLNEKFTWKMSLVKQVAIGTSITTILEFVTGMIFNIWLGMNMWDYSELPFNLFGQVSLLFMLLWTPLVLIAILLDGFSLKRRSHIIKYFNLEKENDYGFYESKC